MKLVPTEIPDSCVCSMLDRRKHYASRAHYWKQARSPSTGKSLIQYPRIWGKGRISAPWDRGVRGRRVADPNDGCPGSPLTSIANSPAPSTFLLPGTLSPSVTGFQLGNTISHTWRALCLTGTEPANQRRSAGVPFLAIRKAGVQGVTGLSG